MKLCMLQKLQSSNVQRQVGYIKTLQLYINLS